MNENEQFLNRLLVVDNSISRLSTDVVKVMLRPPNLEREFKKILLINPFLINLDILKLIWIKRKRNSKILKDIRLVQTVGDICKDTNKYSIWLQDMLWYNDFTVTRGRTMWCNPINYNINNGTDSLDFGEIRMGIIGDRIPIFIKGNYSGELTSHPEIYVSSHTLQVVADFNGEQTAYYLELGKYGLYIVGQFARRVIGETRKVHIPGKLSCGMDIDA